jgi:hypothetical protein
MAKFNRRMALQGLGASIGLPWLESLAKATGTMVPAQAGQPPVRLAWLYVPNGVHLPNWRPNSEGKLTELPATLKPLEAVRNQLTVLTGLTADKARPNGDGPGDHARALSAFLTGCQARKTDGTNISSGISVDQVAAGGMGHLTRLPSLEIGAEAGAMAGNCDSGYSCVYSSTMAWRSSSQPLPKEVNPAQVFDRLFGATADENRKDKDRLRRSVLDAVTKDASSLRGKISAGDKRKLDEYLDSVRDIELRMARAEKLPPPAKPPIDRPKGVPASYGEHLELLTDLLVLAFQTDTTRVATFVLANEGSNRPYPWLQVPDGHHDLSHHGKNGLKQEKIAKINLFHAGMLARLGTKLAAVREGEGSLLDHCLIAYGSGNSDGDRHNHDDLPVALLGGSKLGVEGNRHVIHPKETPITNLWLAMLAKAGIQRENLGDSTGLLKI